MPKMKKNTPAKLDDDEIESLVKKYIDKHLPRSVSKVGGTNMSFKPKSDNKPKEVNKQQKGSSTRIVNTIKINLTKKIKWLSITSLFKDKIKSLLINKNKEIIKAPRPKL